MITSKDNEKLKLVRRLAQRKHREREGLFATEGEDLLAAGLAAGWEPELVLVDAGSELAGEPVARELLDSASVLGSGSRAIAVWRVPSAGEPSGPVCVYLDAIGDPGNVGAVIRSARGLVEGSVALGPGCADPYGPRAVRASMGAVFTTPLARCEVGATPAPRVALVAHGGDAPERLPAPLTVCLGAEREGLRPEVIEACERRWTIPLRAGAESLNVAAAAAIALERLSSAAAEPGER